MIVDIKPETDKEVNDRLVNKVLAEYFGKNDRDVIDRDVRNSDIRVKDFLCVINLALFVKGEEDDKKMFDRFIFHPSADKCQEDECWICAVRDCPYGEPLHYHHDGCPACYGVESKIRNAVDILAKDALECWNSRSKDAVLNRAMYHRIDALVLAISKIESVSFVDACKKLGIDYDELQVMMGDEKK